MRYILDTNIIMALYNAEHAHHDTIKSRLENSDIENDDFSISILSIYEIEYSMSNTNDTNLRKILRKILDEVLAFFDVVDLNISEAKIFADLKAEIKRQFKISRENMKKLNIDLMIASSAISNGTTFVSNDQIFLDKVKSVSDYSKFESWK